MSVNFLKPRNGDRLNILFLLLLTTFWLIPLATARSQTRSQLAPADTLSNRSGTAIVFNNRTLPIAWSLWEQNGKDIVGISDTGLAQLGIDLLNTNDPAKQPIQWFSEPKTTPIVLAAKLNAGYRYLNISNFAQKSGWQMAVNGNTLEITSPATKVQEVRIGKQTWGDRIVVDLDRPTAWQVSQQPPPPKPKTPTGELITIVKSQVAKQEWLIAIDAALEPVVRSRFNSQQSLKSILSPQVAKLETTGNLTNIRLRLPVGVTPRVSTITNPNRLVIDIRPDSMVERNILWTEGLRWRQQYVNLGNERFPVVWLEVNPKSNRLSLKPIWSQANSLVGTAPLIKTAERHTAVAAINAGFFNRKNQLPLGAIRLNGQWLSSPILNRGAIAWNNVGKVKIGRLSRQETVTTTTGQRLPITTFNSGYVQTGIARYASAWGANYTPLTDGEIIAIVQNNSVTAQLPGGKAGEAAFPIPANGYLLVFRGNTSNTLLPIGSIVRLTSAEVPADFAAYPQILAAGPVLVQNRQIVLNAKAEGFSDAFIREKAIRSVICTTSSGNLLIAAVHNRAGGAGATLAEAAKVMQQLGCVDALNFDGGSSTSLYLGGQLLNRSPRTAARVHNGLGIFLQMP
ncbi:phosphodiester glycosidase family protein [Aliterella atlantica]|uniref:phosphodiester glycosidase family protein n=1 Tax=Aliterella atlantica TaxID=1827278 RepID=UPI001F47E407|nr:phosphodiester glycosidase family protein [Aliterella atlantica]